MKKNTIETNHPIGIFDSGVGGLTIAKAITELLPNENIIYFGDTINMPYGDKTHQDILSYVIKIIKFLEKHKCKAIIIACNSATAAVYDTIKQYVSPHIALINVIDPVVEYMSTKYANKHIGLIATRQTVQSHIFQYKFDQTKKGIKVSALATRLLAPAIEDFGNHELINHLINIYLSHPHLQNIDALLLACTHYPLIKDNIDKFYQNKIDVIDPSYIIAEAVLTHLKNNNLLKTSSIGEKNFYVSAYEKNFVKTINTLFNDANLLAIEMPI